MTQIRFLNDFRAFLRDLYPVEGSYGPRPLIPPFLERFITLAFPQPDGNPAARNIADYRTKKEGKSTLAGAVGLYMAARQEYAEVVIVASDRDQAKDRVLRSVKYAIDKGPLSDHAKIYRDTIELDNGSLIQAMPNDWQGAAGGNYSCIIFDELHSWVYESNRRMFDEMVIPPTQPHGCRWIASYAGFEGESVLLREWWDRSLQGKKVDPKLPIYHNQSSSLLAFVDVGEESWRMPWMTKEYLAEIKQTERPNTFRRIWLNEWVSSESRFVPEGAWENCQSDDVKPVQPGDHVRLVLGADASTSRDLTALVGVAYNYDRKVTETRFVRVWKPQVGILRRGKPTVDLEETIGAEVKRLHKAGQIDCIVADPYQLHGLLIEWEKAGIKVIELPQTNARTEADQALYDAIIGRAILHYGDPVLNQHIKNAVAIESIRGFRLAKEKTSQKIDAAVSLSMAHYGALEYQKLHNTTMTIVADPFANWPPPEGSIYHPELGWVTDWNLKPHPEGVTWKNCRYRAKGCQACYEELKEKRENDKLIDEARSINAQSRANVAPAPSWAIARQQAEYDFLERFKRAISKRI
ncbi:MAG: terminase large subunit [Chloroflexi bacterium]|nr:terminase large subunit [Chloroflexota bacterium]